MLLVSIHYMWRMKVNAKWSVSNFLLVFFLQIWMIFSFASIGPEPMDICTTSTSQPRQIPSSDVIILEGHTSEVRCIFDASFVCILFNLLSSILFMLQKSLTIVLFTIHLGVCLCMVSFRISPCIRVGISVNFLHTNMYWQKALIFNNLFS